MNAVKMTITAPDLAGAFSLALSFGAAPAQAGVDCGDPKFATHQQCGDPGGGGVLLPLVLIIGG